TFLEAALSNLKSTRSSREGQGDDGRRVARHQLIEPEVARAAAEQTFAGAADELGRAAIDELEAARVIEREHRDVELLQHRLHERARFEGFEPLLPQRLAELVDL